MYFVLFFPSHQMEEHKDHYIDVSSVRGEGIVFLEGNDPLSRITLSVTKQEYSTMGFFYCTRASGKDRVQVVLVDVLGMVRPTWLSGGTTIEELANDNLISAMAIKNLNPVLDECGEIDKDKTQKLNECFRAAIADVSRSKHNISAREFLYQLFGHRINCPEESVTSVEMVNRVISLMGKEDNVPQGGQESTKSVQLLKKPKVLCANGGGQMDLLTILSSGLGQQQVTDPNTANKVLGAYLADNTLFGELKKILLPKKQSVDVELERELAMERYGPFLKDVSATFLQMITYEQGFLQTVIDGINKNNRFVEREDTELNGAVLGFNDDFSALASLINDSIHSGCMEYNKLEAIINRHNERKSNVEGVLCKSLGHPIESVNLCKDIVINVQTGKKNKRKKFIASLMCLRDNVSTIIDSLENDGQEPYIDVNALSELTNTLLSCTSMPDPKLPILPGEYSYPGHVIVTNEEGTKFPMILSSGKKVTINTRCYDITKYTRCELEEILSGLDYAAVDDPILNKLRARLVDTLL